MTIVIKDMDWTHGMVFMTSSKRNDMMVNVTWLNQLSSQLHVSHIPREVTSIFSKCYEKKNLTQFIKFLKFECK
jgi:hypothetical protein